MPPGERGNLTTGAGSFGSPEDYVDAERTVGSTADYQTELIQPEYRDLEAGR
jgi:hypothetical protein